MNRLLAVAALACCLTSLPARAVDDPALPDGGSFVIVTDAGTGITVDLQRTTSWNMAIRSDPASYYRMCEYNLARVAWSPDGGVLSEDGGVVLYDGGQIASQGTCTATSANQDLENQRTFDISVPANRRYLAVEFVAATSTDGGQPSVKVQAVSP